MSDFLGHLAARSLGRLETLQPRLPSRFEPAGPGVAPGLVDRGADSDASEGAGRWSSSIGTEVQMAASRAVGPSPLPQPALAQGGGTPIGANSAFEKGGRGSLGAPASRRPDSAEPQEPARTPALPGRNLAGTLAPLEGTPRPDLSAAKVAPRPPEGEPASPLPALGWALRPDPAPRPAAATMPPEETPPTEEPAPRRRRRAARPAATGSEEAPSSAADRPVALPAANRLAPRSAHGESAPAAVRLEPRVTLAPPVPAAGPPRIQQEPRSSAAPTLQVTIGRIEVRATPAPAGNAASTRKTAAPQVTLAEYLDRRSRGGRR